MDIVQEQLDRLGCGQETSDLAHSLIRQAKLRTAPGSGHGLGNFSASLVPACALIASQRLNNGEVTIVNAQSGACLNKPDFAKALQIVRAALEVGVKPAIQVSYETLLDKYATTAAQRTQLLRYFREVENKVKMLGFSQLYKNFNITHGIFFWVCTAAKIELGKTESFVAEHNISFKRFVNFTTKLNHTLIMLHNQISKECSRPASPKKASATSTPRRSPRKQRELPTRDSPKKRQADNSQPNLEESESSKDVDMLSPETPTKKRRLDSPEEPTLLPSTSTSRLIVPLVASASSLQRDDPFSLPPAAPRRTGSLLARSSPLKQTRTTTDLDFNMNDPPSSDESETEISRRVRRFRPVYLDHSQWFLQDPRLPALWKRHQKQKDRLVGLYGHPFEQNHT